MEVLAREKDYIKNRSNEERLHRTAERFNFILKFFLTYRFKNIFFKYKNIGFFEILNTFLEQT